MQGELNGGPGDPPRTAGIMHRVQHHRAFRTGLRQFTGGQWKGYAVALAGVLLMTLVRFAIDPLIGDRLPYLTYLIAVVISAWYGGFGPTLFSIAAAWFLADFLFAAPRFSLLDAQPDEWLEAVVFVVVGLCFSLAMKSQRDAKQRAEASTERFRAQSELLEREVQEHQRAVEQLQASETRNAQLYKEAAQANTAKDEFIAVLSHELRTPLTPVLLTASALEADHDLPPHLHDSMALIRYNINLEARLIDDLLDLTRIVRGKLQLRREVVDLHDIIGQAILTCCDGLEEGSLQVTRDLKAMHHHVRADPARLQQVLWNLIKNAVKFTPKGGRITIRSRNDSVGHAVVEVTDTGIGIEPAQLAAIFNAFEQGGTSITRRFGGLGLGLAITKKLIEMHSGDITAASPGKDQGSTFTVSLPTVSPPSPRADGPDAGASPDSAATTGLRILLVEDHPSTAQVMARLLRTLNYKVAVAHSVADALACAAREPFDLMISDLGLPDASGYDLMRQIHQRHHLKGIALSGYGMEDDVRKSEEAGFAEHLIKPVDLQHLEAAIQRLMPEKVEREKAAHAVR